MDTFIFYLKLLSSGKHFQINSLLPILRHTNILLLCRKTAFLLYQLVIIHYDRDACHLRFRKLMGFMRLIGTILGDLVFQLPHS